MQRNKALYFQKNMESLEQRDRVFLRNPVFVSGLGIAPLAVATSTMNRAVILGAAALLLLVPVRVLGAVLSQKAYFRLRGPLYALAAGMVYVPVYIALRYVFGLELSTVGLYLPLLVTESLTIYRHEQPTPESPAVALRKSVLITVGFELALFATAAARELFAYRSLFGNTLLPITFMSMAELACGGLIVMALLAALWQWAAGRFKRNVAKEAKRSDIG